MERYKANELLKRAVAFKICADDNARLEIDLRFEKEKVIRKNKWIGSLLVAVAVLSGAMIIK